LYVEMIENLGASNLKLFTYPSLNSGFYEIVTFGFSRIP
jgi:hypothetical protein